MNFSFKPQRIRFHSRVAETPVHRNGTFKILEGFLGLTEQTVADPNMIERGPSPGLIAHFLKEIKGATAVAMGPAPAADLIATERPAATAPEASGSMVTIEAPMVGTFYRASSPTAEPYVHEGDLVKEGQILCIIEAMKLMNEIESKAAGRVMKICVDNAHGVEYGQPLFVIDPAR